MKPVSGEYMYLYQQVEPVLKVNYKPVCHPPMHPLVCHAHIETEHFKNGLQQKTF